MENSKFFREKAMNISWIVDKESCYQ